MRRKCLLRVIGFSSCLHKHKRQMVGTRDHVSGQTLTHNISQNWSLLLVLLIKMEWWVVPIVRSLTHAENKNCRHQLSLPTFTVKFNPTSGGLGAPICLTYATAREEWLVERMGISHIKSKRRTWSFHSLCLYFHCMLWQTVLCCFRFRSPPATGSIKDFRLGAIARFCRSRFSLTMRCKVKRYLMRYQTTSY